MLTISVHNRFSPAISVASLIFALSAPSAVAQHPERAVALVGGVSQFDLSGTGTTGVLGLRGELSAKRWLVFEAGLTAFRPDEQFGQQRTYVIPEIQVQAQVPSRSFRPYVGLGVGSLLASGNSDARRALSAAAGTRIVIPETRFNVRAELRVRGIGESFSGAIAEWTVGSGYRF